MWARTHTCTMYIPMYVHMHCEAHMHWVGFRRHAAPTCATFEIDIWPDFVNFDSHAAEAHSTRTCTHALYAPCVYAYARRARPRDRGSNNKCALGALSPDGAGYEKGAPIFWQVPLSSSARRHLLTFNGPHEARRNVTFNWVNDHESPLRETLTDYHALNPFLLPKTIFILI